MKKNESSWRDRFDMLKQEHDKTLIELMDVKKRYNELLDKYNSLLSTTESNE
jgi:hypothetical protein